jgi:hypothetical protein
MPAIKMTADIRPIRGDFCFNVGNVGFRRYERQRVFAPSWLLMTHSRRGVAQPLNRRSLRRCYSLTGVAVATDIFRYRDGEVLAEIGRF